MYDPRVGKFLSVDPIARQYPELTPYQYASDRPIDGTDRDGKEWDPVCPVCALIIHGIVDGFSAVNSGVNNVVAGSVKEYQAKNGDLPSNNSNVPDQVQRTVATNTINEAKAQQFTGGTQVVVGNVQIAATFAPAFVDGMGLGLDVIDGAVEGAATRGILDLADGKPSPAVLKTPYTYEYGAKLANGVDATGGSETLDLAPMHESTLNGRELIIDENISPKIIKPLDEAGFSVKTFPKGTPDVQIIKYAKQGNSIVLTNNIADFRNAGITAIKVTANQQKKNNLIVSQLKNLSNVMKSNPSVASPGKVVSLANPE